MFNENVQEANRRKGAYLVKNLEKRGFTAEFCETVDEARARALRFVQSGMKVSWGGSVTLDQLGLRDELRKKDSAGEIEVIDGYAPKTKEEQFAEKTRALTSDVFFMGTNAVTLDGVLANTDGNGNRVAALCFGPKKVVVIIGMNKVCADLDSALKRISLEATPANAIRLGIDSPCSVNGNCVDCYTQDHTLCSMTVVTRMCTTGRIHVIVVNESLGF